MQTFTQLLKDFIRKDGRYFEKQDLIHASLASTQVRINALKLTIDSLLPQVDTLHVFLQGYESLPYFLNHEKIFITQSQDFGDLGECGKYYWVGDLKGFHFICSDTLLYPSDYIKFMKEKLESVDRTAIVALGGYKLGKPIIDFDSSTEYISEMDDLQEDIVLPLVSDNSIVFHSSAISVSRHHFYQQELSSLWFSIVAFEQDVKMVCMAHNSVWLKGNQELQNPLTSKNDPNDYRSFLLKAYFGRKSYGEETYDINGCFDRIYVMNLDRRPDRWEKVKEQVQRHDIHISKFFSVDGYVEPVHSKWNAYFKTDLQKIPNGLEPIQTVSEKYLKYKHHIARINFIEDKLGNKAIQSPGAMGYAYSYIQILKEAIGNNYGSICIFDDDIILHKNFGKEFKKRMQMLKHDWKLIMLGAMQQHWETTWIDWVNENLYHCNGSSIASHAVCIDKKVFLQMLYYAEKLDLPIDEGAIYHIQSVYSKQSYIFYPNLAIQDVSDSEINSSTMSPDDILKKENLFKWNHEDYE